MLFSASVITTKNLSKASNIITSIIIIINPLKVFNIAFCKNMLVIILEIINNENGG